MAEVNTDTMRMTAANVVVRFGGTTALAGVDFACAQGEIHALLGENGAGKSTLMKVLSGAVLPNSGNMTLDGTPFAPQNPGQARLAGVAMIHQELSVAPHLSVAENIALGMEPSKGMFLDRELMHARAAEALGKLGHGNISLDARAGDLFVWEQQLVEIARSIALGCRVLILDEPTSSLTRQDVKILFELLRNLQRQNYAIIYISHFLEEVQEIADRFTILRDGRAVATGDVRTTSAEEIVAQSVGIKLGDVYQRSVHTAGEVVLDVQSLSGATRFKSASLTLRRGEVLGIAGLVGSGRTELLRAIFGLDAIASGTIKVFDRQGWLGPAERWRYRVGFVSENRKDEGVAAAMDIADNVVLPRTENLETNGLLLSANKRRAAQRWIEKLSIKCSGPQAKLQSLSGGNQQKVALARLLHADVDVLILDEPTRGIDVKSKSEIYALIDELACAGKAILIVSSYLPELLGICDRISIMRRGHLSDPQYASTFSEHDLMLATVSSDKEDNLAV